MASDGQRGMATCTRCVCGEGWRTWGGHPLSVEGRLLALQLQLMVTSHGNVSSCRQFFVLFF